MKKFLSIMSVFMIIALVAGASFAHKGMTPQHPVGVDPEKVQQYCKEVQPLWQKNLQLRGELLTLWSQQNPDWNAIKQKEKEIVEIRVEMRKKAYEMGLPFARHGKGGMNIRRICGW